MKREYSWGIVGALALAATAGLSFQGGGSRPKEGASAQTERRAGANTGHPPITESSEELACDDIAKALRLFLNVDKSNLPLPDSCFPQKTNLKKTNPQKTNAQEPNLQDRNPPKPTAPKPTPRQKVAPPKADETLHLKFVIATLPDPVHTHLPLVFDRLTEVIQEGAQDDQYSYESSWMPWEDKEDRHARLADDDVSTDRREKREAQPGILLFRRIERSKADVKATTWNDSGSLRPYQDGLVVLIVGEDPTRGIHLEQFRNAVLWIEQLKKFDSDAAHTRMGILGPSFSGSFHSLEKLLTAYDSTGKPSAIEQLHPDGLPIYSGTANGATPTEEFTEFVRSVNLQSPPTPQVKIEFHHFMETDEVGMERYCRFVNEWTQGRDGSVKSNNLSIAIISEDQTAFGTETKPAAPSEFACISKALWLYYPRDISALRAAYQANSIFDSSAPQQLSDVGRGSLPTDLADPEGDEHDTVRSYGGDQTPISQEAYLLGLVNAMREAHSEYVILRSTNSLDQIFLARYLHRAYPDARIIIDGADNLFERERGSTGMAGTLSLSTYPLLERQHAWLIPDKKESSSTQREQHSSPVHRSFNSDFSEATYVALRMLLHSKTLNQLASSPKTSNASAGTKENPGTHIDTYVLSSDSRTANRTELGIIGSLPMVKEGSDLCVPLADYGLPVWQEKTECFTVSDKAKAQASFTPPTWISVIGRDGFWAMASLNEDTLVDPKVPATSKYVERMELEIPASLKVGLIILGIFAGFHLWCCARASFTARPAFRTHFINPGDGCHIFLVFLGSVFVMLLPLLTAWGCGWFDSYITFNDTFTSIAVSVVLALSFVATFANIWRVNSLKPANPAAPAETVSPVDGHNGSKSTDQKTADPSASEASHSPEPETESRAESRPWTWLQLLELEARLRAKLGAKSRAELGAKLRAELGTTLDLLKKTWIVSTGFLIGLLVCLAGFFYLFVFKIDQHLSVANRYFSYYRSVHLLSGVSPIVPFLAMTIGMYLWFWYSLHGLALFGGKDTCKLPNERDLLYQSAPVLRMFSQQTANYTVEAAKPLACDTVARAFLIWVALMFFTWTIARSTSAAASSVPIRTLGPEYSAHLILICLMGCFSLMIAEVWQLLVVWSKLRTLLVYLDRTALRRTLAALRGFSWGSVWKMSGNVLDVRYKLMSRQFESLQHTRAALDAFVRKRNADYADGRIMARFCVESLGTLKTDPDADLDDVLRAIAHMRKVATLDLRGKLDAARDAVWAKKGLRSAIPDPDSSIELCVAALKKFAAGNNEYKTDVELECFRRLGKTGEIGWKFAEKYAEIYRDPDAGDFRTLEKFQLSVAKTSGYLLTNLLIPEWQDQKCSLILDEGQRTDESASASERAIPLSDKEHIRDAEEFVCLPYLGFVQNILGRIRTLTMGILCLFIATAVAVSSYPFDPRQGLGLVMLILFSILVGIIIYVYAQIHRDTTLSHITNTTPGELGSDFWLKLVGFGLAPLLGLLTAVFPSISDFVFSWLQPGLQSIK